MRVHARITLLLLLCCTTVAVLAPAAAQAAFSVESFFASNCKVNTCKAAPTPEEEKKNAELEGFTQAGGHPNFGITDFTVSNTAGKPNGKVNFIRTDVAPGLATNPQAVPQCKPEEFGTTEAIPGKGLYAPPTCSAETIIGTNSVVVFVEGFGDVPLEGTVYNLVPPKGRSSSFGVALDATNLGAAGLFAHTLIEGNVEWGQEGKGTNQGDYHDYFEIQVSTALPLLKSRLAFKGNIGKGGFLTNATSCPGHNTTKIKLITAEGETAEKNYTTPIGLENCGALPFEPGFALSPETTQSDVPDGITTRLTTPHSPNPNGLDDSQLKTVSVKLPEGMTLNPSAAAGLEACTPAQARIHSSAPGVACPGGSKVGTVELNVPGLPPGSLTGNVYLGGPESGPITGAPYTIYVDAESERYGVSVRLKGEVIPNEATGQLTTVFSENPEQPFSEAILSFKGGALAPIANPLTCTSASTEALFTPYAQGVSNRSISSAFTVDSNGKGGSCASPLPFGPTQSTSNQVGTAGANTSFSFTLARPEGQQYVKTVSTTLPEGLLGLIPKVEQCAEANAMAGTCSAASALGSVSVKAGSGPTPFEFNGTAYLTGPYHGAPYGMSVVVPAVAGPFNLGLTITRAAISVNKETARVTVSSELPPIVHGGVPVRLRSLTVNVNRQGFLINPTNCGVLATESSVTGSGGSTVSLSSPFQVEKCSSLKFKPSFKAKVSAKTSKANGASLETTLNLPAGGANVKSVLVTLPVQLPSRLTTLQKACPEATFAANPYSCPPGSFVGGVRANTPTLKDKLKGPAILVSHGGAAFPDLDLVLEADGVRVILKGNTDIKNGITTTNFATTPDAPVSSITVNLPTGPHSALAAHGDLCTHPLLMPTVMTGQNGTQVKQNTKITVANCGVRIVGRKVVGNTAYITVRTFAGGRISGTGNGLAGVYRHLRFASGAATLKVPLSGSGRRRGRPFSVRLRVGFVPSNHSLGVSAAFVTVTFR